MLGFKLQACKFIQERLRYWFFREVSGFFYEGNGFPERLSSYLRDFL